MILYGHQLYSYVKRLPSFVRGGSTSPVCVLLEDVLCVDAVWTHVPAVKSTLCSCPNSTRCPVTPEYVLVMCNSLKYVT